MKKTIKNILTNYENVYRFIMHKNSHNTPRSCQALYVGFFIMIFTRLILPKYTLQIVMFNSLLIISGLLIISPHQKMSFIKYLSKKRVDTMSELMKEFTHKSYICGFFWVLTLCIYLLCLFMCSSYMFSMNYIELIIISLTPIVAFSFFTFSIFYFAYHLYFNSELGRMAIRIRLQFYSAIMSTMVFSFYIFGESYLLKIFLSGLVIVYTWLNYLISKEENDL